jgi:hypothetical protein
MHRNNTCNKTHKPPTSMLTCRLAVSCITLLSLEPWCTVSFYKHHTFPKAGTYTLVLSFKPPWPLIQRYTHLFCNPLVLKQNTHFPKGKDLHSSHQLWVLVICFTPTHTPKHSSIRGDWSHYADTSEPVDGKGAENMVTVQSGFRTSDGPARLPTALTGLGDWGQWLNL